MKLGTLPIHSECYAYIQLGYAYLANYFPENLPYNSNAWLQMAQMLQT